MRSGQRNQLITFERSTVTVDDYGGETHTFADLAQAWAAIRWGSGQERREAAQEIASKTGTFICDWNPTLAGVTETDRIVHSTGTYDITDVSPMGHKEIHFTGTRSG